MENDHWFRVPDGVSSQKIHKPAGESTISKDYLSDDFSGDHLGLQWQFFKQYAPDRFELKNKELILRGEGYSFANSSPVLVNSADRKYEVQVEFTIDPGVRAGLCLFYNEQNDENEISFYYSNDGKT